MEEKKNDLTQNEQLSQRLAAMEDLLQQQLAENKKIAKSRKMMSLLMLCLVVVFAAGMFWLNSTFAGATRDLPVLIESTTQSVQQMETTLKDVSSIDFDGLNKAITEMDEGLASVDFEALNDAILDLQKAAEGLANLTQFFR